MIDHSNMPTTAIEHCLQITQAHACIQLNLDEALGWAHGMAYQDFVLLTHIAQSPQQRLTAADLMRPMGLPLSALVRLVLPLEKTGLLHRDPIPDADGKRYVTLRPAGQTHLRNATVTAQAACATVLTALVNGQRALCPTD
ncbi:MarR family winged helix-turn-helix transcriptional regulator [Roseateles albus]|uniref:AsnC family transcriptional regulator n=1 Tax=Roseateles albus TaxID=2987525 RepID=A0ABT5KHX0_9BURK|nr:AsnC family transcriptional regulator [Roseateles albus]MDC8773544.1 AsnC family transcriptional regulator [Roseateles albus]